MNILEFKEMIIEEVKLNASVEMTSDKEEFLNYVTDTLIDAEEIEEFIYLPFEGLGKKNRKILIDGYAYNELDEYLSIFIAPTLTYNKEETLTNSVAEKIFANARNFIEDAAYIQATAEESAPGYGLAVDIQQRYKNIKRYCIYLITDMVMSNKIKELKATKFNGIPVEYYIWDISRLNQLAQSSSGKEDIIIDLKQFHGNGLPCLPASKTDDYTAYLCNIPGIVLAEIYNLYGGRLLEGNVRSFLQTKGKVNKGIRNTILNNPEMFFAYNNGIAATAYDLKTEDLDGIKYITEITSLQIVNGGQTTASLAMSFINDKKDGSQDKIKNIYVPMKLSIVSPENAQKIIPNISRFANSQNKVSDADLWSNHPFHIRIEEFSRRIIAPAIAGKAFGTHWFYERANGQYKQETYKSTQSERKLFELKNPPNQMFKKIELAKYINIYQLRPDIASAGGQKSFNQFANWVSKEWERNETGFNEGFFRKVVCLGIIFRQADKIIKRQSWYNSYKANIIAYTMAIIFHTIKKDFPDKVISFKNIWSKQGLSNAWIMQIEVLSKIMYDFLVDPNRGVENVTEWAKRETCWDKAKKLNIEFLPEFIEELTDKSNDKQNQRDDKQDQKLTNNVNAMVKVADFGVENWKHLLDWDNDHKVLSLIEIDFIKSAIAMNQKFPSEKQCLKIIKVLEKARIESYPK